MGLVVCVHRGVNQAYLVSNYTMLFVRVDFDRLVMYDAR